MIYLTLGCLCLAKVMVVFNNFQFHNESIEFEEFDNIIGIRTNNGS
jgi:hypothetical protein